MSTEQQIQAFRETYATMTCELDVGTSVDRDAVLRRLVELQYERNDVDFHRGTFRVRPSDALRHWLGSHAERGNDQRTGHPK